MNPPYWVVDSVYHRQRCTYCGTCVDLDAPQICDCNLHEIRQDVIQDILQYHLKEFEKMAAKLIDPVDLEHIRYIISQQKFD